MGYLQHLATCITIVIGRLNMEAVGLQLQHYATRIIKYDDMKLFRSVMWTMKNLGLLQCLAQCAEETYCVSFQHSSLENTCVVLSETFHRGVRRVSKESAPGWQFYETARGLCCVV